MKIRKIIVSPVLILGVLVVTASCVTTSKGLIFSVASGDYAGVKRSIEEGADVNAQDNDKGTALMAASQGGHKKIVKLLKKAGATE